MKKIPIYLTILLVLSLSVLAVETEQVCEIYDDFSGETLDLTKWEEIQDTDKGQPLTDEHYLNIEEQNYHVQNINITDQRTILNLIGKTFQNKEILKYDVNYISGEGNRAMVIFLNGKAIDTILRDELGCDACGSIGINGKEFDIGNEIGIYNIRLEFVENGINMSVVRPDETLYTKFIPFVLQFNVGFETWSNGKIHSDYDNFEICSEQIINYDPVIDSFLPIETNLVINETDSIEFTHTSTDQDNDTLIYSWLLNDVEQSTEQNWIYISDYNSAGNHTVKLIVSDESLKVEQEWNIIINNIEELILPEPVPPAPPSGSSSGGGGTSWTSCVEDWKCSAWSICENQIQTRTCYEVNECGTSKEKPELEQSCIVKNVPDKNQEQQIISPVDKQVNEEPEVKKNVVVRSFVSIGSFFKKIWNWIF